MNMKCSWYFAYTIVHVIEPGIRQNINIEKNTHNSH